MKNPLYGLILAGGKSTRMGRDKGALIYHDGKDQVRYLHQVLASFVDQTFVSIRSTQFSDAHLQGYDVIEDARNITSPLNGILSAMDKFPEASWLVVAVDMPYISETAVQALLNVRDPEVPATCFSSPVKGGPDPLFAIWEVHAKAEIEALVIKQSVTCPRKILTLLEVHLVENGINAKVLRNINTPQEYQEVLS
ncbi:MAG: molybdenum cofactor guanylyltransferase [Betaproteobacteria bacterium]|nr:molybdenum cofactor guanylyltransferase [Betaproteobacteria bacterium]